MFRDIGNLAKFTKVAKQGSERITLHNYATRTIRMDKENKPISTSTNLVTTEKPMNAIELKMKVADVVKYDKLTLQLEKDLQNRTIKNALEEKVAAARHKVELARQKKIDNEEEKKRDGLFREMEGEIKKTIAKTKEQIELKVRDERKEKMDEYIKATKEKAQHKDKKQQLMHSARPIVDEINIEKHL